MAGERHSVRSRGDAALEGRATTGADPPRWAEYALRIVLNPRDRDPITGDLLEEYREVVLPARGRPRADVWYLIQAGSLMNRSNSSVPASIFVTMGALLLVALGLLMMRSDFGPPPREIIPFGGVAAIAAALLVSGITVIRSAADFEPIWRVSRFWGIFLGASITAGQLVAWLAIPFFMDDGPPPHPGHISGVNPAFVRLFVVGIIALFMTAGFRGAWRTRQVRQGILAAVATGVIGASLSLFISFFIAFLGRGAIEGGSLPLAMIFVAPMLSTVPGTIGAMCGKGLGDLRRSRAETSFAN